MSVRTSVRPQKISSISMKFGMQVEVDEGVQYDPVQGQGHEPLKGGNPTIFKGYLLLHLQWGLANDD